VLARAAKLKAQCKVNVTRYFLHGKGLVTLDKTTESLGQKLRKLNFPNDIEQSHKNQWFSFQQAFLCYFYFDKFSDMETNWDVKSGV
jgi:hypothetical protein